MTPMLKKDDSELGRNEEVLWYTRCPLPTAAGIAISDGLLERQLAVEGVSVRSLREAPGREDRHAHFTHRHPALFRQGGNIPPIWARSEGADTRVIGLTWIETFQGVITLPETGIRTPADLAGTRLALPRHIHDPIDFWRVMTLRGLLSALSLGGLKETDARLVDLPIEDRFVTGEVTERSGSLFTAHESARLWATEARALVKGEVDAIYVYGPVGLQTVAFLDAVVVADLGAQHDRRLARNGGTPATITVSAPLLEERPDLVELYLRTLLDAAESAAEDHDHAFRIFAAEAGAGEEWARLAHPAHLAEGLRPSFDPELVEALDDQIAFLFQHGFIERTFDLAAWLDPDPLSAAEQTSTNQPTNQPTN